MPVFSRLELDSMTNRLAQLMCSGYRSGHAVFLRLFRTGDTAAITEFLEAFRQKTKQENWRASAANKQTVQDVVDAMFCCASYFGELEVVQFLLQMKAADVNITQKTKSEALMKALGNKQTKCVELLVAADADVNSMSSPLCAAVKNVHDVKLLLAAGADVNLEQNHGALAEACFHRNNDSMKALLEAGADVNQKNRMGVTPLFHATAREDTSCMKLLLEAGADVNQMNLDRNRPLPRAIFQYNMDSVKLLLQAGADINLVSQEATSALRRAVQNDDLSWVLLLLDAGADANQQYGGGYSLLVEAIRRKNTNVIKLLLRFGAFVPSIVNPRDLVFQEMSDDTKGQELLLLLFAAGCWQLIVKFRGQMAGEFLPADWHDFTLKNQCRKEIREHLLRLNSPKNLFVRFRQLETTADTSGLPQRLVSYLLWDQTLDIDWSTVQSRS